MPDITGDEIFLRDFTRDDITDAYLGWLNDPTTVRFSNQRFRHHDYQSASEYLKSFADTCNLFIAICHRATSNPVGTMTAYINPHHQTADVGILIGSGFTRGIGLGRESWQLLCDWLLHERRIRKLTAGAAAINTPMIRIMERYGMDREAVLKEQEIVEGTPVDILLYSKYGYR